MLGYGEIYRFEFDGTCNPFGTELTTKCKVSILKKDYTGTVTTIPDGQASPVTISYPTTDDDIFYPIKGSSISFKIYGGVLGIDSISSDDEKEYLLEYYRDANLFWRGFVSPEMCEEDIFLRYPAIQFTTIDGLGSMEGTDLQQIIDISTGAKLPIKGYQSFTSILSSIFDSVSLRMPFNLLAYFKGSEINYLTPEQSLTYMNILINSLYGEDGVKTNTLDILKSIGKLFNAIIFQDKGEWWFVKPKDVAFGYRNTFKVDIYNSTTSSNTIPILEHGTDFLIVAEPKRKLKKLYKAVEVEIKQLCPNGNVDTNFSVLNYTLKHPTVFKPEYTSYNETTTVGGITTVTTYYDKLSFVKYYNQTDITYRYPSYKYFTPYGNAKGEMIFNPTTNDYAMVVRGGTTSSDYVQYSYNVLSGADNKYVYDIGVSSITKSIKISIVLNGQYYNASTESWQNTEIINTFSDVDSMNITNIQMPGDGILMIRFYAGVVTPHIFFDGVEYSNISEYHNFKFTSNIPKKTRQLITATNIKDATIVPDRVTLFNGMTVPHPLDNISYPTYDPWYNPQFAFGESALSGYVLESPSDINLNTDAPNRMTEIAERNEPYYYSLQELCTRNILNQYSDNTNIFSGTIIGKNLRFGAIYKFPNQGALADKLFFPLSMELDERECTADVVFLELSTNEIDPSIVSTIYDSEDNIRYQQVISSKKKIVTA